MSPNVDASRKIQRLEDLGISPHQILLDLQKWEAWGYVASPAWGTKLQDQGMTAEQARLWLWRKLAKHYARKAEVPYDDETALFTDIPKVGELWRRKTPLAGMRPTVRVTEVDPEMREGDRWGLVRAVTDPPLENLGGCKHSFQTFLASYDLEEEAP